MSKSRITSSGAARTASSSLRYRFKVANLWRQCPVAAKCCKEGEFCQSCIGCGFRA